MQCARRHPNSVLQHFFLSAGALRASGPYPVLAIAGEQGSAKTVLSKLLRAMIDPSVAPVRALPRDERELFIAASNGHVLAFDNLSGLPPSRVFDQPARRDREPRRRRPGRPMCARSWPTERNGWEAHPTFCRPALPAIPCLGTGPAGQRTRAHSLAGCTGHRPSCARLFGRVTPSTPSAASARPMVTWRGLRHPPPGPEQALIAQTRLTLADANS